jgi:hypothetical protein
LNTITALPVLHRNPSNDVILVSLAQPARGDGRREAKSEVRDSNAQDCAARVTDQLAMDFGEAGTPQVTRRSSRFENFKLPSQKSKKADPQVRPFGRGFRPT